MTDIFDTRNLGALFPLQVKKKEKKKNDSRSEDPSPRTPDAVGLNGHCDSLLSQDLVEARGGTNVPGFHGLS